MDTACRIRALSIYNLKRRPDSTSKRTLAEPKPWQRSDYVSRFQAFHDRLKHLPFL